MTLAPSNMSSSAIKTPAKSPTSQTEDPPDTDEKSLPDSDPLGVKKMMKEMAEEEQLEMLERATMLEEYLNETTDPRDIEFMARLAYNLKQKQTPSKTPQETTSNDPQDPIYTKLFPPTIVADIPPEVKSASKPAAIDTEKIKQTTTSTGKGSSDPSKQPSTPGSNGPTGNRNNQNPPPGGNSGGTN